MSNSVFSNDWAILNGYSGGDDDELLVGQKKEQVQADYSPDEYPEVYSDPSYLCYESAIKKVQIGDLFAQEKKSISLREIAEKILNTNKPYLLLEGDFIHSNMFTSFRRMLENFIHSTNLKLSRSYRKIGKLTPYISFSPEDILYLPNTDYPSESTVQQWIKEYELENKERYFYKPRKESLLGIFAAPIVEGAFTTFGSGLTVNFTRDPSSDWNVIGVGRHYRDQPQFVYAGPKGDAASIHSPSWQEKFADADDLEPSLLFLRPFLYTCNYMKALSNYPSDSGFLYRPPNLFEVLRFCEELFTMPPSNIDLPNWGWLDHEGPRPHFLDLLGTFFGKYLPIYIESLARRGDSIPDKILSTVSSEGTSIQPFSSESSGSTGMIIGATKGIVRAIFLLFQTASYYGPQQEGQSSDILEHELSLSKTMVEIATEVYQEAIDGWKKSLDMQKQIFDGLVKTVLSVVTVVVPGSTTISSAFKLAKDPIIIALKSISAAVASGPSGVSGLEKALRDLIEYLLAELTDSEDIEGDGIEDTIHSATTFNQLFSYGERRMIREQLRAIKPIIKINH